MALMPNHLGVLDGASDGTAGSVMSTVPQTTIGKHTYRVSDPIMEGGRTIIDDLSRPSASDSDPPWFDFGVAHQMLSLECLSSEVLQQVTVSLALPTIHGGADRSENIVRIVEHFKDRVNQVRSSTTRRLMQVLDVSKGSESAIRSRGYLMARLMENIFSQDIMRRLRVPPSRVRDKENADERETDLAWEKAFGSMTLEGQILALRKISLKELHRVVAEIHPSRRERNREILTAGEIIVHSAAKRVKELAAMTRWELADDAHCWDPQHLFQDDMSEDDYIAVLLRHEYTDAVINAMKRTMSTVNNQRSHAIETTISDRRAHWPQVVPEAMKLKCINKYFEATQWSEPPVCCVCSRQKIGLSYHAVRVNSDEFRSLYWGRLGAYGRSTAWALSRSEDKLATKLPQLQGLLVDQRGVHATGGDSQDPLLDVCHDCKLCLARDAMPRLALANGLYRGRLPKDFRDLTWVEEMVCCKYRTTAIVTRLYSTSDDTNARIFKGNTCAHEMNIVSTASKLPRAPEDVNGMLSVVFIGPKDPTPEELKRIFYVRKGKVWDFLCWLKDNNPLYADIELDEANMNMYRDDDTLPGIEDRVIGSHASAEQAADLFKEETAGLVDHPAELMEDAKKRSMVAAMEDTKGTVFLEKTGIFDAAGNRTKGRELIAAGLRNLLPKNNKQRGPGLVIKHGKNTVDEYQNPALFPGMFPTLFPFGIGGFEWTDRRIAVSYQAQAEYFLEIADREFRYHHSFIFVALNILQRRKGHLHASFTVKRPRFKAVAQKLTDLSRGSIDRMAKYFEQEGPMNSLDAEQKVVVDLLKEVNTVAARVPGSEQSKIFARNEIRSYTGYIGVPQLFVTLNPSPQHSPLFQVMYGDKTVDLTTRYPVMVAGPERARRLARDPIAAADFFDLSIRFIFEHLFGWNYKKRESSRDGGLLGHLSAFYGTAEYTERGCLHGHFLIWLDGGLNPSEIHKRLNADAGFQQRFFAFFDDIIKHELPEVEEPDFDLNNFEPATERPPRPPQSNATAHSQDGPEDWEKVMARDHFMCGEKLQRHRCRAVCHKYGNEGRCRFLFPHEVVQESRWDEGSNSIIFACRDATVNYHNPFILVFCRHNHDIRCILSGRSAKAAIFYITDYITKMDSNTNQMLSLLCKAALRMPENETDKDHKNPKTLLHKCLAQFQREQQINAQQAVRYLRDSGDSISSHPMIPMMSGLLMAYVHRKYGPRRHDAEDSRQTDRDQEEDSDDESEDEETEEFEGARLKIAVTDSGALIHTNQVDDYIYRDEELQEMSFFDFVCEFQVKKKDPKRPNMGAGHYQLVAPHALKSSHQIVRRPGTEVGSSSRLGAIPRIVGTTIPRETDLDMYALFVLAHFKPFSSTRRLLNDGEDAEDMIQTYQFPTNSQKIIDNWKAIHECEDARDAEQLRRREAASLESDAMTKAAKRWETGACDELDDEEEMELGGDVKEKDKAAIDVLNRLFDSGYLKIKDGIEQNAQPCSMDDERGLVTDQDQWYQGPGFYPSERTRTWDREIKDQENVIYTERRNLLNLENQHVDRPEKLGETEEGTTISMRGIQTAKQSQFYQVGHTKVGTTNKDLIDEDPSVTMDRIACEHTLNEKQTVAFQIAARAFIRLHEQRHGHVAPPNAEAAPKEPLRMLMTGPGGTGKSHSVFALKSLMDRYASGHRLRLLAPTGSAAVLIDGMTCHKALSLKIRKKKDDEHGIPRMIDGEDYHVAISSRSKVELRSEWKNVDIVLIDEVSLLSLQCVAEIDHALRYAKEKPDMWFGGMIVLFSGDFFQFPPIGGAPLFKSITYRGKVTNGELQKRLGRLAWKTVNEVVEFTEQFRMKSDPEYGDAVGRLRIRKCTEADVRFFNSRVIRSKEYPKGVDMSKDENAEAVMIVSRNYVREKVNLYKAKSVANGEGRVVMCAAMDYIGRSLVPNNEFGAFRTRYLTRNMAAKASMGSLPGFIPLYEGMPVMLRTKNLSVDLKIANGSQGVVTKIETGVDAYGYTYAKVVLVRFPGSKIKLSKLPAEVYPIRPIVWSFWGQIRLQEGAVTKHRIQRHQLPIQPAFAFTGHSAQGKTMPKIIADLADGKGGWAAYVSASRARRREDLYLLREVQLRDLTKSLPLDLLKEKVKFEIMEHNTLIRHGFKTGKYAHVPDVEDEMTVPTPAPGSVASLARWDEEKESHPPGANERTKASRKRKCEKETAPVRTKRVRLVVREPKEYQELFGSSWCQEDWSCAYDCTFTAFWVVYLRSSAQHLDVWRPMNSTMEFLGAMFKEINGSLGSGIEIVPMMRQARDRFRDHLHQINATRFPRRGEVAASAAGILESMFDEVGQLLELTSTDDEMNGEMRRLSRFVCSSRTSDASLPIEQRHTLQCWINNCCTPSENSVYDLGHSDLCAESAPISRKIIQAPPWLYIDNSNEERKAILPSVSLRVPTVAGTYTYQLCAIIYAGGNHFTARLFLRNRTYLYDSQSESGRFRDEGAYDDTTPSPEDLGLWVESHGRTAHQYVFQRKCDIEAR